MEIASAKQSSPDATRPMIELDIAGDSVWIWRGADESLVTAVIRALKKKRSDRA